VKITKLQIQRLIKEILDGSLPSDEQEMFDIGYNDAMMGMPPQDFKDDVYMAGYSQFFIDNEKQRGEPKIPHHMIKEI